MMRIFPWTLGAGDGTLRNTVGENPTLAIDRTYHGDRLRCSSQPATRLRRATHSM
jgi:hypothetical protein